MGALVSVIVSAGLLLDFTVTVNGLQISISLWQCHLFTSRHERVFTNLLHVCILPVQTWASGTISGLTDHGMCSIGPQFLHAQKLSHILRQ